MQWIDVKILEPRQKFKGNCPDVLIKYPFGKTVGHQWECGQWVDDHIDFLEDVTHWMELPSDPIETQHNQ